MKKSDLIALLLEDGMEDEVRIMSSAENIDEFEDPEAIRPVSDRIVGVNNGAVEGVCLILTNAPAVNQGEGDED